MKNLSINVAKDITINDLVTTPNSIVLANESVTERNGESTKRIRFIVVCPLEKTDALSIIKSVLKYVIAENLVGVDLEKDFKGTNIKQRKLFNQFLRGNRIYRTNAEGRIASAFESEVPLSQTALNVKKTHTIVTCQKENRKAAIHQHAKAIQAQGQYLRLINDKVERLEAEPETTTAPKRRPTSSATQATPPAMVAAPAQ